VTALAAVASAATWVAADVVDRHTWTIELTEPQRRPLGDAARRAAHEGRGIDHLDRASSDLAPLQPVVAEAVHALGAGRGFVLLR
jgi:hypothetical protein